MRSQHIDVINDKIKLNRVNLEYYGYENGALWNLVFLHILNSTENFANRHVRPQHIDVINDTVKLNHVNLEYCEFEDRALRMYVLTHLNLTKAIQ